MPNQECQWLTYEKFQEMMFRREPRRTAGDVKKIWDELVGRGVLECRIYEGEVYVVAPVEWFRPSR